MPYLPDSARFARTLHDAIVALDAHQEATGLVFEVSLDLVSNRLRFRWVPQVGDLVSYSINGDSYHEGEVVKVTRSRFSTSTGRRFSWSRKWRRWCPTGSPAHWHSAHPRVPEKRDPSF